MSRLIAAVVATVAFIVPMFAFADTLNINFEPALYSVGNINAQNGWSKTGSFDVAVSSAAIPASFGTQSLRVSDAITSESFGDQTFSPSLANEAGESMAQNNGFSGGTRQTHFETQFDIASAVPGAQQPGLHMTVSADRGDGARMSYLRFEDQADGIHVFSDDYIDAAPQGSLAAPAQGCDVNDGWTDDDIATLDRSQTHTIKLTIDFADGPANDVLKVYVDGVLKHTGTTWEDYYRWCTESGGGVIGNASADVSRTVDSLLFREAGSATPANSGNGFLVDNMTLSSGPAPSSSTVVVMPGDMHNWVFINDQTDGAGSGTMVAGPATAPLGDGSAQLIATTSSDGQILELPMTGTRLADLTTLQYSTYQDAANQSIATAIALQFNVDKDITDADDSWQGRIVYEPYINNGGTVPLGSWNTWDALNSGNAKWWFSKPSSFGGNCSQASPCTLTQILSLYPNIGIHPALGAVVLKAGSGWSSFSGNVDDLVIGINNADSVYDFEPAPPAPAPQVHIFKFIDGVQATAANANSAAFPMLTSFLSSVYGSVVDAPFTLSPTGWGASDAPYEASYVGGAAGDDYSAHEVTAGNNVVGASCSDGQPFALSGYTTGDTLANAQAATLSTATPSFANLQKDEYMIVWNTKCVAPPVSNVPTSKDQCMNNGWKSLVDGNGKSFKNQGDCVSFVATKGKNTAAGN